MNRLLSIVLPLLIIGGLGFGGSAVLNALKPEPETSDELPQALSVFAERTQRRDLNLIVDAQGEVRPRSEIDVTPQVQGRISYVSDRFLDGGFVSRGQVLVRLDAADYELDVIRARAGVATAQQALAREQAEAELAIRDIEDLGITETSPLARREPQLAEAQATLDSAYAQLSDANLALERTAIRAPFDGRVRQRSVDVGQFVAPGQSLGRVFSTDIVEVALPLTDDQLGQLNLPLAFAETSDEPGPKVIFQANVGGKTRSWEGRVTRTAAAVNSESRLINVFGELEDPYGEGADGNAPMAPGLFVTASIQGDVIENTLWAPRSALRGDNNLYIGNVERGALSIREVDVIYSDASGVYFENGASENELAIVSPIQAAFDGMRLRIRERLPDGTLAPFVEPISLSTGGSAEASTTQAQLPQGEVNGVAQ
ncbi:MAG: efflux RND transporter periplasmic adaptor subunit [Pseudomonadota bacterium]